MSAEIFSTGAKKLAAWIIASGSLLVVARWVFRIFMRATDIDLGYNWSFDGTMNNSRNMRPNFDPRNRSQFRTYRLANISYEVNGKQQWCDNASVWGKELKPTSIEFIDGIAPVQHVTSLQDCMNLSVILRFQDNTQVRGHGPGQQQSRFRFRMARLRVLIDKASVSLD